ncbi:carbohydrate ABC transporter permease [Agromyces cerinus]|uniref:Multiple sugar transport system permease protein n=1 Tax=Agromyces cerinus subsp. cerinus TaxID=232089 RepID=A0A1N6H9E5_9MICO|nr:carbohydrate ABC transporter permease [Agromyces cerinus]SIO16315.1 multiple sugar transport system permease protein [Agromyces cerinus subsp. cerinus]
MTPTLASATRPRGQRDTTPASRFGVMAVLLLAAFYFLMPIWWLIVAATKPAGHQFSGSGLWFDGFGLVENIALVFDVNDGIFGTWMLNSIFYSGTAALIGTIISAMAGYAIAKYAFRGRGVVFGVILAAVLIPKVMFTLPLFLMFNQIGLLNTPLAMLLPSIVSPFGVYLASVFAAQSVPDELIEAGRLDGAGEFRIFRSVSMRIMTPALVTIFLFQFVEVWNNYLLPAMVLNDSSLQPVVVGLVGWSASNGNVPAGTVVVGAFLSIIPLVIAFLSLQRFWRAGLTAGAIK